MSDEADDRNPFRCFRGPFLRNALLIALAIVVLAFLGRRFEPGSPARLAIATAQAPLMAVLWGIAVMIRSRQYR